MEIQTMSQHSKLTYSNSRSLLKAYPVAIIKDMLKESQVDAVLSEIMSQNNMCNLIAGKESDDYSIALQGQMFEEIKKHVQHIADYRCGVMDLDNNAPKLEDYSNFNHYLVDLCSYIKSDLPTSQLNDRWEFAAFIRDTYPEQVRLLEAVTERKVGWLFPSDRDTNQIAAGIIGKTVRNEEAQAIVPVTVKGVNERHTYVSNAVLDAALAAADCQPSADMVAAQYQQYIGELVRSLASAVISDEKVLRKAAAQLHHMALDATSSLACTMSVHLNSLSALDSAVVGLNVQKLQAMKLVLKQEADEQALLDAEEAELQAQEEAQRKADEAAFSSVLAYEQRKLELADKVRDGSITLDELKEYKEMR